MGIASLVLGIVSVVVSFVPFCGTWAIIPAIVGLILGIVDWSKKKKAGEPKGKSIAGTVCSIVAVIIIVAWWILALTAAKATTSSLQDLSSELQKVDWNTTYRQLD